jgi:hypothetical protein
MRKHAILTLAGLVLGIAALAIIQPMTTGGATFLVGAAVLVTNAVGAFIGVGRSGKKSWASARRAKTKPAHPGTAAD